VPLLSLISTIGEHRGTITHSRTTVPGSIAPSPALQKPDTKSWSRPARSPLTIALYAVASIPLTGGGSHLAHLDPLPLHHLTVT